MHLKFLNPTIASMAHSQRVKGVFLMVVRLITDLLQSLLYLHGVQFRIRAAREERTTLLSEFIIFVNTIIFHIVAQGLLRVEVHEARIFLVVASGPCLQSLMFHELFKSHRVRFVLLSNGLLLIIFIIVIVFIMFVGHLSRLFAQEPFINFLNARVLPLLFFISQLEQMLANILLRMYDQLSLEAALSIFMLEPLLVAH